MTVDFIDVYPKAIPDDLCERLVAVFDGHPDVYTGKTGGGVDLGKKNSTDLLLDQHPELAAIKNELLTHTFKNIARYFEQYALALMGAVSVNVEDNLGNLVCLTPDNFDEFGKPRLNDIVAYLYRSGSINLQKYQKGHGGYPHWHSEQFPQADHNEPLHRVVFYMYYLNDIGDGGETEFFYQERKVKPRKGTMLVAPAGFTHSHRGNTPISDDKYIATSWIMFNRSSKLFS